MKQTPLKLLTMGLLALPATAGTVLFTDNFDAPETVNLDTAPLTGRLGGSLAGTVKLQSRPAQIQTIAGNMWRIFRAANDGRLRFHKTADLSRFDWAAGTTGSTILAEGGLRVEFDWLSLNTPALNAALAPVYDANWITVGIGLAAATDVLQVVNDAQTDLGILFRHNGGTQYFDNGAAVNGGNFPATINRRHVVLEYAFSSFANAAVVTGNAWVNGTQVMTNKVFDWNNNAGALYFEIGSNATGNLIDNLAVSTLAAGLDSDTDTLPDQWEMAMAGNLTSLGASPADFDGDGLTDAQEYALGLRTFPGLHPLLADTDGDGLSDGQERSPTAPRVATDPTLADTDYDGLTDFAENKTGDYVNASNSGTDPTLIDTDADNFPDGYEAQSGGNPMAIGTIPVLPAGVTIGLITDEASTGLSTSETYTHKMSGGGAATVNGVALDVLNTTTTPANFTWDALSGSKAIVAPINNASWVPASGTVSGTGNLTMLGGLSYSGNGGLAPCTQRYTFAGLETGRAYELRIYTRMWSTTTVRPIALKFINGAEVKNVHTLLDRPGVMTGTANDNKAYYFSYNYVAGGPNLVVEAATPRLLTSNGSFHMYGMSNRVAGPPADLDGDGISDLWEIAKAGNTTTLGASPADYDNDGLTDVQEYTLSATYFTLNPLDADSDDDGLNDGPEVNGAGARPPTNPIVADTDADGLSDLAESNTGTYVSGADTGTNPLLADTDSDTFRDAYEITAGSNPSNVASRPALPGGVAVSVLTDDASTGISATETYTHKISGGYATSVNGVAFDALTDTLTPVDFTWAASGGKNIISPLNNNNWVPATGGVTGPGLLDLFGGFSYSGAGATAGSTQRFTLSGLTAGLQYEVKLFIRPWDQGGGGRPIELTFTNGAEVAAVWPGHNLQEDRPGNVTANYTNQHVAYAVTFTYVAQGASLLIDANVPLTAPGNSGSFHLYGLTNRTAGPPPVLDFNSVARAASGLTTTLDIHSRPGRTYAVSYSTDLTNWIELTDSLASTGISTIYVDNNIASNLMRAYYRVDDVTP